MLKNINDYISFITLLALSLFSLKLFFSTIFKKQNEKLSNKSFIHDLINYTDNEDE